MVALAFTSAFAPAALGRAMRGARAGAARRAVPVRAGDEVRSDADDDATTTFRDDLDAPTSRRGLLLGAAHPQLGAAGITVGSTEEGGEVTYAEREEGAEEGAGGDYVASDAEGG